MESDILQEDLSYLEILRKYTFDSKMCICQRLACRIMTSSEVSMQLAYKENIMPWELETFALFSILYDDESSTESITGDVFENIITLLRNYWHPELAIVEKNGTYAEVFFMISAIQQFPVQGLYLQKLFRYSYIFNFVNEKINFKQKFVDNFLTEYKCFDLAAFMIFLASSNETHIDGIERAKLIQKGLSDKNVMRAIQIDKQEYIKRLKETYKDSIIDYYYGLKIQYLWPIIGDDQFNYIPLPYLVVNAVTESLLQRLTIGNKPLRNLFGKEIFESYLYDIYSEVSSVTWISPEITYKIGKSEHRTSDVLVSENEYCVFYDSKSLSPNLNIRKFDHKEIDKNERMYAESIKEVYNQIYNYEAGYFALDKRYEKEKIFGVVVVWDDSYISRSMVYERLFAGNVYADEEKQYIRSHIKVVSLRQIEHMVLQNTSFLVALRDQVDAPTRWEENNFVIATTENGVIPRYATYVEDLKSRMKKAIEKG